MSDESHHSAGPTSEEIIETVTKLFAFLILISVITARGAQPKRSGIKAPPYFIAQRILSVIYSRKAFERVIQPTLGDVIDEYLYHLSKNGANSFITRWVLLRGYLVIMMTIVLHAGVRLGKVATAIWKASP